MSDDSSGDEPQYKHPMSLGIHNTIEGSNYLRGGEYRRIISELERLAEYDAAAKPVIERPKCKCGVEMVPFGGAGYVRACNCSPAETSGEQK